MRIRIRHVTRSVYDKPARSGVLSLRLTPPSFEGQSVVKWAIRAPGIERAATFRDGFGNLGHLISIVHEHSELIVEAEGIVETSDRDGIVRGLRDVAPVRVFLRETKLTAPDGSIRSLARETKADDGVAGLHRLMHVVGDRIEYTVDQTDSETAAADALSRGHGVCQDHAHVFISAARAVGVPARYVCGYMIAGDDQPAEAHHGWAEAWIDGIGWIGFDPTNRICPTDRYVRLGTGLDAASAAPIRGSRQGGSGETLDVDVDVEAQSAIGSQSQSQQ